jgi:hypothetical protein
MSSEKQIEANRLNAQKSTGPKTPEGKEAASMNHLKHGLRARTVVLTALGESQADFEELCIALQNQWDPRTPTERLYLEEMAVSQWRLARAERMQDQLLVLTGKDGLPRETDRAFFIQLSQLQARLKQSFTRAQRELEHCQSLPFEEVPDEAEDAETETNGAPPLDLPRVTDIRSVNKLLRTLDLT